MTQKRIVSYDPLHFRDENETRRRSFFAIVSRLSIMDRKDPDNRFCKVFRRNATVDKLSSSNNLGKGIGSFIFLLVDDKNFLPDFYEGNFLQIVFLFSGFHWVMDRRFLIASNHDSLRLKIFPSLEDTRRGFGKNFDHSNGNIFLPPISNSRINIPSSSPDSRNSSADIKYILHL